MATTVDTLLLAVQGVQKAEEDLARIEEFVLAEKDALDVPTRNALADFRDGRRRALSVARGILRSSIAAYGRNSDPYLPLPDAEVGFLQITMDDDSLGTIAEVLRAMLAKGVTSDSIRYALAQADGSH